jgi:hypothetical protein
MEVCGQLHAPAPLTPGKGFRRVGGSVSPRSQSGRGGEEKNFQPLPDLETTVIQPIKIGKSVDMYPGGIWFASWPDYRITWLSFSGFYGSFQANAGVVP